MGKKKYSIRVRIWVDESEKSFLGAGKVLLLENIGKTGSISKAAKEQQMAYRHAWQLVEDMNNHAEKPLVAKSIGGKGGGGATLTETGKNAIKTFYDLEKKVTDFVKTESKKIKF